MKTKTLSGKILTWPLTGYDNQPTNKSDLHLTARKLLRKVYSTCRILEEVSCPIDSGVVLYLDFYIPLFKIAIEVQGQQHFSYSSFFHGSTDAFKRSKANDKKKLE
ncbi:MAG: hypothetical protein AABY22_27760, partial [Nanoarchaeota archaeon]